MTRVFKGFGHPEGTEVRILTWSLPNAIGNMTPSVTALENTMKDLTPPPAHMPGGIDQATQFARPAYEKKMLREDEVVEKTGLSASTIRNRCNPESRWFDPEFPQPRSLGGGGDRSAVGWRNEEVMYWHDTRPPAVQKRQLAKRTKYPKFTPKPASADGKFKL